jgi:hypothetical protein
MGGSIVVALKRYFEGGLKSGKKHFKKRCQNPLSGGLTKSIWKNNLQSPKWLSVMSYTSCIDLIILAWEITIHQNNISCMILTLMIPILVLAGGDIIPRLSSVFRRPCPNRLPLPILSTVSNIQYGFRSPFGRAQIVIIVGEISTVLQGSIS